MDTNSIIFSLVLIMSLFLGFLVYFTNPKNKINKLFFTLVLGIIVWVASSYLEDNFREWFDLFLRIDFISALFVSYIWFIFVLNFPQVSKKLTFTIEIFLLLPAILLTFLIFSNLIIYNIRFDQAAIFDVGSLYWLYATYNFIFMGGGCIILIYKYLRLSDIEKRQTLYVLIGSFSTAFLALIVNLVLPRLFPELPVEISRIGIYGILFLISFTTYAIVKHQLFDIKVILTETAVGLVVLVSLIQTLLATTNTQRIVNSTIFLLIAYGGYLIIKSVIREIKFREELQVLSGQLAHANDHLKDLDKMKTEFVSLASHELLTPVSAIEGYLSMMLDEHLVKLEDPKAVQYMDRVYRSAKRLARLISDMLNISRIEEGRLLVEKKNVDLNELIRQVLEELKFKADEHKQTIVFANGLQPTANSSDNNGPNEPSAGSRQPEAKLMTFADPDKIKEVLVNLIGNSIKYTMNPGTITVTVEKVPTVQVNETWGKIEAVILASTVDDQESIHAVADGSKKKILGAEQYLVRVKDQGIGIPPEELPKLFKKFHRVGDFSTAESQGTGLGLYITRALVELHHGRVWPDSEGQGKGSTFTFSLPTLAAKQEIIDLEAQSPETKEQLKPLAKPMGNDDAL